MIQSSTKFFTLLKEKKRSLERQATWMQTRHNHLVPALMSMLHEQATPSQKRKPIFKASSLGMSVHRHRGKLVCVVFVDILGVSTHTTVQLAQYLFLAQAIHKLSRIQELKPDNTRLIPERIEHCHFSGMNGPSGRFCVLAGSGNDPFCINFS